MLSVIKSGIGWFVVHLEFQDGIYNITYINYGYIKWYSEHNWMVKMVVMHNVCDAKGFQTFE